jgi:hypothetical protein
MWLHFSVHYKSPHAGTADDTCQGAIMHDEHVGKFEHSENDIYLTKLQAVSGDEGGGVQGQLGLAADCAATCVCIRTSIGTSVGGSVGGRIAATTTSASSPTVVTFHKPYVTSVKPYHTTHTLSVPVAPGYELPVGEYRKLHGMWVQRGIRLRR